MTRHPGTRHDAWPTVPPKSVAHRPNHRSPSSGPYHLCKKWSLYLQKLLAHAASGAHTGSLQLQWYLARRKPAMSTWVTREHVVRFEMGLSAERQDDRPAVGSCESGNCCSMSRRPTLSRGPRSNGFYIRLLGHPNITMIKE